MPETSRLRVAGAAKAALGCHQLQPIQEIQPSCMPASAEIETTVSGEVWPRASKGQDKEITTTAEN